ncbi:MAG TPA: tetratricopeptide repeat protein [Stellaceae bacterium]|nr:tetratricopeptide repeat protein [Stellaceae bacterium]
MALDPRLIDAQLWLARALLSPVLDGVADLDGATLLRTEELIEQALASSPHYWKAHYARGQLLRAQGRFKDAIPHYETAIVSNRNAARAFTQLGWCKLAAGQVEEEVVELAEQAIRLDPCHPTVAIAYNLIATVRLYQSRQDEAIVWFEKAVHSNPRHPWGHFGLAIAYGLMDQRDHAVAELAEAQMLSDMFSSIVHCRAIRGEINTPASRERFENIVVAGLRKAGLSEK